MYYQAAGILRLQLHRRSLLVAFHYRWYQCSLSIVPIILQAIRPCFQHIGRTTKREPHFKDCTRTVKRFAHSNILQDSKKKYKTDILNLRCPVRELRCTLIKALDLKKQKQKQTGRNLSIILEKFPKTGLNFMSNKLVHLCTSPSQVLSQNWHPRLQILIQSPFSFLHNEHFTWKKNVQINSHYDIYTRFVRSLYTIHQKRLQEKDYCIRDQQLLTRGVLFSDTSVQSYTYGFTPFFQMIQHFLFYNAWHLTRKYETR